MTVDDVIDILEEEATEDIYTLGGVQSGEDDYFQTKFADRCAASGGLALRPPNYQHWH